MHPQYVPIYYYIIIYVPIYFYMYLFDESLICNRVYTHMHEPIEEFH